MSQDPYLQPCPNCGRTIAAIAYKCPFCDHDTPQKKLRDATAKAQAQNHNAGLIGCLIVLLLLAALIVFCAHSWKDASEREEIRQKVLREHQERKSK